jgi:hypothetical protein
VSETITSVELAERIVALCIGGSSGLPRKSRDLHILLASATLWMEPDGVYSEPEVNEALSRWLDTGCPALELDVATLRRELVDRLYLNRDDSGKHYTPGSGPIDWRFADDVADVDPAAVIESALEERAARREAHLAGQDPEEK